jgi:folate-binding protein YgfZ
MSTPDPDQYRAVTKGAALFDVSSSGRLRLSGADHLDFLQRLSTNDTLGCAVGAGLRTVFCDPRGRIVEVAALCRMDADVTQAFIGPGRAPALMDWLDRFHFGERIEWLDETDAGGQIEVIGPLAAPICAGILGFDAQAAPTFSRLPHESLQAMRIDAGPHAGVRLWGDELEAAEAKLRAAGVVDAGDETRETLRVEWGEPAGAELTLEHNPWEAGLGDAIHMNKGCYTGQEVVARLDTYKKIKQHLVGLRLHAPVIAGATVEVQQRTVGNVTSVARSPDLGALALAYLRTAHCDPGTAVVVQTEGAEPVPAVVSQLPFPRS